ncbi:hypothetical protein D6853_01545 [Butyrivibrio sp. X503]|nr:hypothetical protein D6853_01545 [Butyrivibrio sp. X503]
MISDMSNDTNYVECLVPSKASPLVVVGKYVCFALAIFFLAGSLLVNMGIPGLILFIAACVGYYFLKLNADIEYEYQYCDREITVDKVLNKASRKHICNYSVDKIEVLAPSKSYHLDEYKNRTLNVHDYSSRDKDAQPDPTYTFIYDGKEKIIIEPSSDFVQAIKNVAPRKVFTD